MNDFFSKSTFTLDELTRVYSKNDILDYAQFLIAEEVQFAFLVVDIDNFKYINDTCGYEAGNRILYTVAHLIYEKTGDKGAVGRMEGDKFAVILTELTSYDEVWSFCHELLVNINEIQFSEFSGLSLTSTMGLARFPENATNYDRLLENCEKALFRGKTKGRNCFIIYVPEKHANIVVKSSRERALSSSNLISSVYKYLENEDLAKGIQNLLDFLSSHFEIDHLCIQSSGRILFEKIHQMSRTRAFLPVPIEIIKTELNHGTKMYCINDIKSLIQINKIDLFDVLAKQNITAVCVFEVSYKDKVYGYLRADMTGYGTDIRIWQYSDLDILLTFARTLGVILHFTGRELESL